MINVNLRVRRAVAEDHQQIASIIFHDANVHRHLDWRSPLDWLGSPNYWVLEEDGVILAALACPEDPPHVAWIRLFGYSPRLSVAEAWRALWEMILAEQLPDQNTKFAAIVVKQWFQNLLLSNGFELKQNIILLELKKTEFKPLPISQGIHIRLMTDEDLPAVTQVDLDSFGSFWHNTFESLKRARAQSIYASVAEDDSGVIGYQISTENPQGAHLARLGVRKEAQGRGVGAALVSDLFQTLDPDQSARLSVNTQSDNAASLSLYKKIGFTHTGEYYPVLVYPKGV